MNRKIRLSLFLLLFTMVCSWSGCYYFTKSDSYFGIKTKYNPVVFVLDISCSMEGRNEATVTGKVKSMAIKKAGGILQRGIGGTFGGLINRQIQKETTKLASARQQLLPAIKGLPSTTQFALVIFGGRVQIWQGRPLQATPDNKDSAVSFLNHLKAKGNTRALRALKTVFQIPNIEAVFFLSDGRPTDARAPRILTAVKALNAKRKIVIHTVGLGGDQDPDFLQSLAQQNGGQYVRR